MFSSLVNLTNQQILAVQAEDVDRGEILAFCTREAYVKSPCVSIPVWAKNIELDDMHFRRKIQSFEAFHMTL